VTEVVFTVIGVVLTVMEVLTKTTKKREIFYSKASEAEICTRVRCWYLTSFAGLHFENYPGLTELGAGEDRLTKLYLKLTNSGNQQNSKLFASKMPQHSKHETSLK